MLVRKVSLRPQESRTSSSSAGKSGAPPASFGYALTSASSVTLCVVSLCHGAVRHYGPLVPFGTTGLWCRSALCACRAFRHWGAWLGTTTRYLREHRGTTPLAPHS